MGPSDRAVFGGRGATPTELKNAAPLVLSMRASSSLNRDVRQLRIGARADQPRETCLHLREDSVLRHLHCDSPCLESESFARSRILRQIDERFRHRRRVAGGNDAAAFIQQHPDLRSGSDGCDDRSP
jgi:hypothetical protein